MTKIDFASLKNQANRYSQIQIILNIQCQFFVYTSTTVIINMHVSFISIGFLVADLVIFVTEIDFAKNQADRYM